MDMRSSRVLKRLRENKVAISTKINLSDIRVAELAASFGFDSLWIDMEHVPNDYSAIENMVRAAKIYDVDVVTRVCRGSYSDLIRPFEADTTAIMVPHLMSLEEAKKVVYYTKFHPIGRRPLDGGNADGLYTRVDCNEYLKTANKERFVIVQIEDPEPLKELDEICALDGIDMIFFGPADFSQGIGKPNQFGDKEITDARIKIAKTALKHGKYAGTVGSVSNMKSLIDIGYKFISIGADVLGLINYYDEIIKGTNEVLKNVGK